MIQDPLAVSEASGRGGGEKGRRERGRHTGETVN